MTDVARIYEFFKPYRYDLHLELNKDNLTFKGSVKIEGKLRKPAKRFRLHSKALSISKTIVDNENCSFEINEEKDELVINLPKITTGAINAEISFKGKITKPMHGIYPCYGSNGETILATQLESHHAREVLPCIDEPEAKAVFALSLTTPDNVEVLANTLPRSIKAKNGIKTTEFADTPVMSSYLLAFVVGNIKQLNTKTKDGVLVRVWATKDKIKQAKFALDMSKNMLEYFNEYFGVPYPLEKCDLVALPDFAAGAMENWGLLTFRETALLVDPKHSSLETKQHVAAVIGHELAHQWFGNLVTMKWWNDLWLNEGFGPWVGEYLVVDHLRPDWKVWTQFLADTQLIALRLDSLNNTHAIESHISHPDEIRTMFDAISYDKSASIIHMLHNYLSSKDFRKGLVSYIKKYSFKNTKTTDLWKSLEESSNKPVTKFISSWTKQPGFPVVTVKPKNNMLQISQNRFFGDGKKRQNNDIWPIPLLSKQLTVEMLNKKSITLDKPNTMKNFRLNSGHSGFYITKYWPEHYETLGAQIKSGSMPETDRIGLVSDILFLTKAGDMPLTQLIGFLSNFKNETSAPLWELIATVLGDTRRVMGAEAKEAIKPYIYQLTSKQYERLGVKHKSGDSYFDRLLRTTVFTLAITADNESALNHAKNWFDKAKQAQDLPPDLKGTILTAVARRGGAAEFDKMLKMYETTKSAEDKVILSCALASFKNPKEIKRALSLIKSDMVKLQDIDYWLIYSFANPEARDATWKWLKDNWQWLNKNLSDDVGFLRMPFYVARYYSETDFIDEFLTFFKQGNQRNLGRAIKQGEETIRSQAAWKNRDLNKLLSWLESTNFEAI